MNNIGEQINQVINNLSQKLGIAVNKLYPALHQQAYIDGIVDLVWTILGLATIIIGIIIFIKNKKHPKLDERGKMKDGTYVTLILCAIAIVIGLIIIAVNFNDTLTALFNPDYYILQKIFNQISIK